MNRRDFLITMIEGAALVLLRGASNRSYASDSELTLDLSNIPFSCYGSYLALSINTKYDPPQPGLCIHDISGMRKFMGGKNEKLFNIHAYYFFMFHLL